MDSIQHNKWAYLSAGLIGVAVIKAVLRKVLKKKAPKKETSDMIEDAITFLKKNEEEETKKAKQLAPPNAFASLHTGKACVPPVDYPNVKRICFTGGPCGGKTSSLKFVAENLRKLGYSVLIVPEAPTLLAQGGGMINVHKMDASTLIKFQNTIIRCVIDLEDNLSRVATVTGNPTILLCDRGTLDPRAYMTPVTWQSLLDDNNWNVADLRDNRYHGVIHLITTADGAEEHYSLENNAARYESTLELAKSTDINLRNAWLGHHSFVMIDNPEEGGFGVKMERAYDAILHFLGKREKRYYRKYLLKTKKHGIPALPDDLRKDEFSVEETFLKSDGTMEEKVSKRIQKSLTFYSHKIRHTNFDYKEKNVDESRERYRIISSGEYLQLMIREDNDKLTLKKHRQYLIWQRSSLFIDTYVNAGGVSVIYGDYYKDLTKMRMPDGIEIEREITYDNEYSSYHLAKQYRETTTITGN